MVHVYLCYNAVFSVPCSIVITYWERAALLALLCVVFACVFVTFPHDVPRPVWYLIVLIPDLCLPLYCNICVLCQLIACISSNFTMILLYLYNLEKRILQKYKCRENLQL